MKKQSYLLGYDLGSSSVKASLVDALTGTVVASAFYPKLEMSIKALQSGWAEQDPELWWEYLIAATREVVDVSGVNTDEVKAIGISYQMHGLVLVDKDLQVLRDAIIWCDSRAVPYGEKAMAELGADNVVPRLLNSPGNFTLSKLAWVKEHEPHIFCKVKYYMLPGDFIALRMTGEAATTVSGLSEGIAWDFSKEAPADFLMEYFGFDQSIIPPIVPAFGPQGRLTDISAKILGLSEGTPVAYRAGDQPNNALSLNVLNPGEIATTAGTSGVVYGVNDDARYDPLSRVNSFAHVNHQSDNKRVGVLQCINGTAILNSWIRKNIAPEGISYADMNALAAEVPIGSDGVTVIPFGNGAERMLNNEEPGCAINGLQFNRHHLGHIIRAAQEGIAFSFHYGMEMMQKMGIDTHTIRAGHANLFLSPLFRQTLSNITGATIELYDTDGAAGAARGAGIGAGIYKDAREAFANLRKLVVIKPVVSEIAETKEAYAKWLKQLKRAITTL